MVLHAEAHADLGNLQLGVEVIRQAIDQADDDAERQRGLSDELVNFCIRHNMQEMIDDLLGTQGPGIQSPLEPDNSQLDQYWTLWRDFQAGGQFEEAYKFFARQLESHPDNPDLLRLAGYALERRGTSRKG